MAEEVYVIVRTLAEAVRLMFAFEVECESLAVTRVLTLVTYFSGQQSSLLLAVPFHNLSVVVGQDCIVSFVSVDLYLWLKEKRLPTHTNSRNSTL